MSSQPYPYTQIRIKSGKLNAIVSALVDTGFNDGVVIPSAEFDKLGEPSGLSEIALADGSPLSTGLFYAVISLRDRELVVRAFCFGDEYLLGNDFIRHFRVCFDHGKTVEIEN